MVKVRDEPSMAEPRPTATTATTTANANGTASTVTPHQFSNSRKPPRNPHYHPHSFYHFPTYYHHHCTYPAEGAEVNGAGSASSPAKFYFGPGFEPQQQGGGRYGAGPSQTQNNEHIVFFHVNPGVTISFQFGDNMEVLRGKWKCITKTEGGGLILQYAIFSILDRVNRLD